MKQITPNAEVRQKLQKAAGDGVDVSQHPVFESIGLNTQPVRKDHPLYKGARHSKNYLKQMADAVNKESVPLQIMHDNNSLPAGRAFAGEVIDLPTGPELRVLFWVDPQRPDITASLNNGTIDQVSVSTIAKAVECSECGFNFIGSDSDFDLVFSGTCPSGHTMNAKGAHAKMNSLEQWFEMSLVGRGGATGARVLSSNDYRLAADGKPASWLTLSLSNKDLEPPMELKDLAAQLTALTTEMAALKAGIAAVEPKGIPDTNTPVADDLAAANKKIADLEAKVKSMTETTKAPTPTTPKGHTDDAGNFLLTGFNDLAKTILIMSGDVEAKIPEDAQAAVALVKLKLAGLKAAAPSKTTEAAAGTGVLSTQAKSSNAFKSAR